MAWRYAKITIKSANPSEEEINTAVYTLKKTLLYVLHHSVKLQDATKQHRFSQKVNNHGVNGNRIWQVGCPLTKMITAYLKHSLRF